MSRGKPFEPGNKFGKGRPKGSRNKGNSVIRRHLEENAEPLIMKTISSALRDNTTARLWCVKELTTIRPSTPKLKLPPIKTLDDIDGAIDVLVNAVANNKYPAVQGTALMTMLGEMRKSFVNRDLVAKVEELERILKAA